MVPAPPQPWADLPKVLNLAKRQNAVIKVSGACKLSGSRIPSRTFGMHWSGEADAPAKISTYLKWWRQLMAESRIGPFHRFYPMLRTPIIHCVQ
jgi:hypothetical protein